MSRKLDNCFACFLLLNGAYSDEYALQIVDGVNYKPLEKSLGRIAIAMYNEDSGVPSGSTLYQYIKSQTPTGTLGKAIEPFRNLVGGEDGYFVGKYERKHRRRIVYFDLNLKSEEEKIKYVEKLLYRLFAEETESIAKLRGIAVSFLIENHLESHEQLTFFGNCNYRDRLEILFSAINSLNKKLLL